MTQPESDRERIDAIRHLMNDLEKDWSPNGARLLLHNDVPWLLDRLAAVEHERDAFRKLHSEAEQRFVMAHEDGEKESERAELAESALLSLQSAVRELMRAVHYVGTAGDLVLEIEGVFFRVDVRPSSVGALGVERRAAIHRLVERKTRLAALLPERTTANG